MGAHFSRERVRRPVVLAVAIAVVLVAGVTIAIAAPGRSDRPGRSRLVTAISTTTTTVEETTTSAEADPTTSSTAAPTTSSSPAPATTVATAHAKAAAVKPRATTTTAKPIVRTTVPLRAVKPAKPPAGAPVLADGGGPYRGFGAWVDVYDWTMAYTKGNPTVNVSDIDRMADLGVQTLYIQAARGDTAEDVAEVDRLSALIDEAHARKMAVVAWYLPYLTDPADDLRHLDAIAALPIEGLGVDIEARNVSDVNERNQRLVDLSAAVRERVHLPLAGIVLPPVATEVINPAYWPGFPWQQIAPFYDVWMPMSYWTNRTQSSGWRDAYKYTVENVNRMRADLGLPNAVVHPVGGIGDKTTADDVDGFLRAVNDTHSIGGSLYDYVTSTSDQWARMRALRAE
jgi:hypothetical protein